MINEKFISDHIISKETEKQSQHLTGIPWIWARKFIFDFLTTPEFWQNRAGNWWTILQVSAIFVRPSGVNIIIAIRWHLLLLLLYNICCPFILTIKLKQKVYVKRIARELELVNELRGIALFSYAYLCLPLDFSEASRA